MALKLSNNASTILAADIDDTVTTVPIWTADAGLFPTLSEGDWFPITVYDQDGNMEIMKVTARVGGDLTVERGQEGTTAKSFSANDRVDIRVTGAVFEYLEGLFDIFTPFGTDFVKALDAAAALNLLGATTLGKTLFSVGTQGAARTAIGVDTLLAEKFDKNGGTVSGGTQFNAGITVRSSGPQVMTVLTTANDDARIFMRSNNGGNSYVEFGQRSGSDAYIYSRGRQYLFRSTGQLESGSWFIPNDGNLNGSRWGSWGSNYAFDAINGRIEDRAFWRSQEWAASRGPGDVGTYGWFRSYGSRGPGDYVAGSALQWSDGGGGAYGGSAPGTWRCMGLQGNYNDTTLYLRVA